MDYAQFCHEQRNRKARVKAMNLRRAAEVDDGGWTKHSEHHWSRVLPPDEHGYPARLDYWPSTDRYRLDDLSGTAETMGEARDFLRRVLKSPT